jgi:hypothetical protein
LGALLKDISLYMSSVSCPEAASCILDFLQQLIWSTGRILLEHHLRLDVTATCVTLVCRAPKKRRGSFKDLRQAKPDLD